MPPDLLAGTLSRPVTLSTSERPVALTFDSGLGGLTVFAELTRRLPGARHVYLADDAAFPYGSLSERALIRRVTEVIGEAMERFRPHLVVIACNTASTLALPVLRARFPAPFVGTVPAVRRAARISRTGSFAVLATPGTIARDYTRRLIDNFAPQAAVTLVGSARLAQYAEADMRGEPVSDADILAEIAPCFRRFVDVVALACTHYPLIGDRLARLAPWPVAWIDPAAAIARRAAALLPDAPRQPSESQTFVFTGRTDAGLGVAEAMMRAARNGLTPPHPMVMSPSSLEDESPAAGFRTSGLSVREDRGGRVLTGSRNEQANRSEV